ncbi:MAG: FecR family protein [Deltaproteobacteria bacterium]
MEGQTKKYNTFSNLNNEDQALLNGLFAEIYDENVQSEISEIADASTYLKGWKTFNRDNAWEKVNSKIIQKPGINWYKYAAIIIILVFSLVSVVYITDDTQSISSGQSEKNIVLLDGSDVLLDENTKIEFDKEFGNQNRTIKLKGNAYFDIAKNSKVPFIINTINCQITVIGTRFYITQETNGIKVEVLEGKVKIADNNGNSKIITDSQSALISDHIQFNPVYTGELNKARYSDLEFDNITVQQAIDSLNSIYKSEVIVLNNDIKDLGTETIHTTIRNSSVKDFARFMEIVFDVNVINSKGQYIISFK